MSDPKQLPTGGPVTSEVRFAAVMYGGISLCVYMNGITEQLHHLVRSTARRSADFDDERFLFDEPGDPASAKDGKTLDPIESVYRRVAQEYSSQNDGAKGGVVNCRFIVDILSGTSAGGLNGLFLARALANHEPIAPLTRLWITEGDIGKLLNDGQSRDEASKISSQRPPESLLNSGRMAQRLFEAQREMEKTAVRAKSQLARRIDLYMTATDLQGLDLSLGTDAENKISERRHRAYFHFVYDAEENGRFPGQKNGRNDFDTQATPFLTFVARATSSIVPAFEPVRLNDMGRLWDRGAKGLAISEDDLKTRFVAFYRDYWSNSRILSAEKNERDELKKEALNDFPNRSFGDGGYGDNYPFGYAIQELSRRRPDVRVDRKFLYIEPDPDIEAVAKFEPSNPRPNVLGHLSAMKDVKTTETIREDIQSIRDRNALLQRLATVREAILEGVTPLAPATATASPTTEDNASPYLRIRAASTTDNLTDVFSEVWGFETETVYHEALRCVVKAIRQHCYAGTPSGWDFWEFLETFDTGYLRRKIAHTLREVTRDHLADYDNEVKALREADRNLARIGMHLGAAVRSTVQGKAEPASSENPLDAEIVPPLLRLGKAVGKDPEAAEADLLPPLPGSNQDEGFFVVTMKDLANIVLDHPLLPPSSVGSRDGNRIEAAWELVSNNVQEGENRVTAFVKALAAAYRSRTDAARGILAAVFAKANNGGDASLKRRLGQFDASDQFIFPVLYGNGEAESTEVDILRISPLDCDSLIEKTAERKRKLAGTGVGHFAGFFKHAWRAEDILWGRLDGAERLICAVLGNSALRSLLILQAQLAILADDDLDGYLETLLKDIGEELPPESMPRQLRADLKKLALQRFRDAMVTEFRKPSDPNAALNLLLSHLDETDTELSALLLSSFESPATS